MTLKDQGGEKSNLNVLGCRRIAEKQRSSKKIQRNSPFLPKCGFQWRNCRLKEGFCYVTI